MTGLKLLFSRYFSHKRILLGVSAFFLLMMAAVMLFHEDPGGDTADYIMCKVSALAPMMFAVFLPFAFMVQDTVGNRFMRSVPCAESLYMRGIPLFSLLVPLGWGALTNVVYAAFILFTSRDVSNISDLLVMTGMFGGIFALVGCIVMCLKFGAIFFVIFYSPFILVMTTVGSSANEYGYGLPLWMSALICCGSYIAAFVIGNIISVLAYRKGNFREGTQTRTSI